MTIRRWLAAVAAALTFAPVLAVATSAPVAAATPMRLAGDDRIATAIEISREAFPTGATGVYLARADSLADAVAAGSLPWGPVLLVPQCGELPAAVRAEIDRLDPQSVTALGGEGAVCTPLLLEAAAGRLDGRLAGADRYATSAAIAINSHYDGAEVVYLARGDRFADAIAAGTLTDGPIVLVPPCAGVPAPVRDAIDHVNPQTVIALGGTGAVCDASLRDAAAGRASDRIAGDDRVRTATAIARRSFPESSAATYLARADVFADAVAAGALTDGPILLVPSCAGVPDAVSEEIARLSPDRVVALGGPMAVCDDTLDTAAGLSGSPAGVPIGPADGPVRYQQPLPPTLTIEVWMCRYEEGTYTGADGNPVTITQDDQVRDLATLIDRITSQATPVIDSVSGGRVEMDYVPGGTVKVPASSLTQRETGWFDIGADSFLACMDSIRAQGWEWSSDRKVLAIDALMRSACQAAKGHNYGWTSAMPRNDQELTVMRNLLPALSGMLNWHASSYFETAYARRDVTGGKDYWQATDTHPYNKYASGWYDDVVVHSSASSTYVVGDSGHDLVVVPSAESRKVFFSIGLMQDRTEDAGDAPIGTWLVVQKIDQENLPSYAPTGAEHYWSSQTVLSTLGAGTADLGNDTTLSVSGVDDGTFEVTVSGSAGSWYWPNH